MKRSLITAAAIATAAGAASAQTASFSMSIPDFTLAAGSGATVFAIDTSMIDFTDPYIAFRVTADWSQGQPMDPNLGAWSNEHAVSFGDPSTFTLLGDVAGPLNGAADANPVTGMVHTGAFDGGGLFGGIPIIDLVGFGSPYGDGYFANVTIEWFTAEDIPSTGGMGGNNIIGSAGAPSANTPMNVTDLGAVGAEGDSFSMTTVGSDIDTEIGLYAADGTLLASNDDAGLPNFASLIEFISGGGEELVFNPDGTIEFATTMGETLAAGTYYLGVGEFDTDFAEDFAFSSDIPGSGGNFVLDINGVTGSGTVGAGPAVQWFSFTVTPTPGATLTFGLAGLAAARRRRA